ncbi:unnamed protein product [Mycena citricolor]|uniref:Zn(2)-C6 fungal-type domain-containing protein n=1 Tax=Mycena citricolor TaxID=2018698 RepID=A0AAD2K1V9_9AGAR|nr:unnamed protein product [Mycena citricolor]
MEKKSTGRPLSWPYAPPAIPATVDMQKLASPHPSTRDDLFFRVAEPQRLRTSQACEKCRIRKAKCSGERPTCGRCEARGLKCEYSTDARGARGYNKSRPRAASTSLTRAPGHAKSKPAAPPTYSSRNNSPPTASSSYSRPPSLKLDPASPSHSGRPRSHSTLATPTSANFPLGAEAGVGVSLLARHGGGSAKRMSLPNLDLDGHGFLSPYTHDTPLSAYAPSPLSVCIPQSDGYLRSPLDGDGGWSTPPPSSAASSVLYTDSASEQSYLYCDSRRGSWAPPFAFTPGDVDASYAKGDTAFEPDLVLHPDLDDEPVAYLHNFLFDEELLPVEPQRPYTADNHSSSLAPHVLPHAQRPYSAHAMDSRSSSGGMERSWSQGSLRQRSSNGSSGSVHDLLQGTPPMMMTSTYEFPNRSMYDQQDSPHPAVDPVLFPSTSTGYPLLPHLDVEENQFAFDAVDHGMDIDHTVSAMAAMTTDVSHVFEMDATFSNAVSGGDAMKRTMLQGWIEPRKMEAELLVSSNAQPLPASITDRGMMQSADPVPLAMPVPVIMASATSMMLMNRASLGMMRSVSEGEPLPTADDGETRRARASTISGPSLEYGTGSW